MSQRISVVEKILSANERQAADNRVGLDEAAVFSPNLLASPDAGKTSLIEQTVGALTSVLDLAVIDGDIASNIDADRASATGATAVQINTGGECHLDAVVLHGALDQLVLAGIDLLLVENIGNLVCPAGFRLGTHKSVLTVFIPEGEDNPGMYRGVDALVLNKIDLLPFVQFDMTCFQRGVEALNPGLVTFPLSCRTLYGI